MNVNQNNIILPGSQPAALGGNTYQYESVLAGPIQRGGKSVRSVRFSRRRGRRSRRRSSGRKSRRVRGGRKY